MCLPGTLDNSHQTCPKLTATALMGADADHRDAHGTSCYPAEEVVEPRLVKWPFQVVQLHPCVKGLLDGLSTQPHVLSPER